MPPTNSIVISYRRSDSSESVGRIYDFLSDHFGNKSVFKDVDSIPAGRDFRTHLNETIGECLVLIAKGKNLARLLPCLNFWVLQFCSTLLKTISRPLLYL